MKTLETTLTRPRPFDDFDGILNSQEKIEAALEQLEHEYAKGDDNTEFISSEPVRKHIQMLNDNGMPYYNIAKLSGVHKSLISRIVWGKPSQNMGPQARISVTNSERILSVAVDMIDYASRLTNSIGTIRRIQALGVLGYSLKAISEESGLGYNVVKEAGKSEKVTLPVEAAIKAVYERLRDKEADPVTPAQKTSVTKAKNEAEKNGWASPKAWDDTTINDPRAEPAAENDQEPSEETEDALSPEEDLIKDCVCKKARHEHGTRAAYSSDGCRCLPCKEANRDRAYYNRKQRAYGRSKHDMVDIAPARQHLKKLRESGWSVKRIAANTGVGKSTIIRLTEGGPGNRPDSTQILATTSARILSFRPKATELYEEVVEDRVSSIGTQRRVQALMACGYPLTLISKKVGIHPNSMNKIMNRDKVLASTAASFKAVYDELWDVQPPRSTTYEKKAYTTAKRIAEKNGWLPPMAWDDDRIDNPKYKAAA